MLSTHFKGANAKKNITNRCLMAYTLLLVLIIALSIFSSIFTDQFKDPLVLMVPPDSPSTIKSPMVNTMQNISSAFVLTNISFLKTLASSLKEKHYAFLNAQYFNTRGITLQTMEPINPLWAKFDADWPCLWSEDVIGREAKDGVKWGCGLRLIKEPCVVYSMGSHGNWLFEEGTVDVAPHCKIFTFDPRVVIPGFKIPLSIQNNTKYFKIGVVGHNDDQNKFQTLPTIMNNLNHTHIDILKMDIEGYEWQVFFEMEEAFISESSKPSSLFNVGNKANRTNFGEKQQRWPSIGQIYVEFHLGEKYKYQKNKTLQHMIEILEDHGFRIFHKEVNAEHGECCSEYSFIQARWEPNIKNYPMCR